MSDAEQSPYRVTDAALQRLLWRRRARALTAEGKIVQMGFYCCLSDVVELTDAPCPEHGYGHIAPRELLASLGLQPGDLPGGIQQQTEAEAARDFEAAYR